MKEINETGKLQYYKPKSNKWKAYLVADLVLVAAIIVMLKD